MIRVSNNKTLKLPAIKDIRNYAIGLIVCASSFTGIQSSQAQTLNKQAIPTIDHNIDKNNISDYLKFNKIFQSLNIDQQQKSLEILSHLAETNPRTVNNFFKLFTPNDRSNFVRINRSVLFDRDQEGNSLIDNLHKQAKSNIFFDIGEHKNKLISDTLELLSNPDQYSQGSYGICSQVTKCFYLATRNPSEFVNLINLLTIRGENYTLKHPDGSVILLKRNKSTPLDPDANFAISLASASFLEYVNSRFQKYDMTTDTNYQNFKAQEFNFNEELDKHLLEAVTKTEYANLDLNFLKQLGTENTINILNGILKHANQNNIQVEIDILTDSVDHSAHRLLAIAYNQKTKQFILKNSWGENPKGDVSFFQRPNNNIGIINVDSKDFFKKCYKINVPKFYRTQDFGFNSILVYDHETRSGNN